MFAELSAIPDVAKVISQNAASCLTDVN